MKISEHTNAILVPCKDKQEWLSQRTIGGSSSPNLYGVGYSSRYAMWSEFVEPPAFRESTERQQIGLGLEDFVCNLYQQKYGGQVEQWPRWTIARHPEREYLHCTPDATVIDTSLQGQFPNIEGGELIGVGPGSLSVKTWSEYRQCDWEDGVPTYCDIQLQHELAVLGWNWGVITVLFGAQRLERFIVPRNDYFIADLYEACGEFWRYVTDRVEPPIDESRATSLALARLHPDDSGAAVRLPGDADDVILEMESAKETIKAAERIEARTSNQLKAWIGDATYGVTPDGRTYSWKTQTRKSYTVAESTCRVLRAVKSLPKGIAICHAKELIDVL